MGPILGFCPIWMAHRGETRWPLPASHARGRPPTPACLRGAPPLLNHSLPITGFAVHLRRSWTLLRHFCFLSMILSRVTHSRVRRDQGPQRLQRKVWGVWRACNWPGSGRSLAPGCAAQTPTVTDLPRAFTLYPRNIDSGFPNQTC